MASTPYPPPLQPTYPDRDGTMATELPPTRVALVTGAAQGIGEAIARQLADDGLDIALNDIPQKLDQLSAVAKVIESKGCRATIVTGDVTVEEDVASMVSKTAAELGALDVMIANAGIFLFKPLLDTSVEEWERMLAINGKGVFLSIKYAAKKMIEQGRGGRIICAASVAGIRGSPVCGIYCASKFAVRGLVQSAALELKQHGITVNAYCPGFIATPMIALPGDEENGGTGQTIKKLLNYPAEVGKPSNVANTVSYLAKPESAFVTGQSMVIDGGLTMS
ncbi:NAD-P-binding protein [Lentinus tigrinus ALCF2SS1-7]|uniref:NAD-P-binding protein n=1 Tax=Lentinus tigrinus ALCF2SS1-6 TaxID=1328759 RepID=A0A5C2S0P8_9APHY|nr:NAD-P-binding protein [Lentinus tigrinus ALCF2SS1-6]RPD71714.1 NAD-P-binding protein [Lentinus tigrinus ALCF2SS1-7]